MTISYPSRPVMAVDTPEVRKLTGNFVYNFFVPDERLNDEGDDVPKSIIEKGADSFDNATTDVLNRIPRFVRLSWPQVRLDEPNFKLEPLTQVNSSGLSRQNQNFIRRNLSKIYKEEEFSNSGYSGIEFQDTGLDGKLHLLVSGTVAKLVNSNNIELARAVNEQIEFIAGRVDTNNVSLLDVSKFLAGELDSESLPNQTIIDALTDLRSAGTRFFSDSQQKELIESNFESLKNVKTRFRINNKFIKTFLNTVTTDPLGFFADEVAPLLSNAEEIQNELVQNTNPDSIDEAEFEIVVDPVSVRSAPKDSSFLPTRKHIGYIIDKFQRNADGSLVELDPIILESENTVSTVDYRVAYGFTYVYQIRSIYLLEFQTFSDDEDEMAISTILVSSAPSSRTIVTAEETVAPPPPSDVNIFWDYDEGHPCISWCFPVNSQRDIKKWQVFRRKTIDEAFELIIELDFDDSAIPTSSHEKVSVNLSKKLTSIQNFWVDKDFEKDDRYIYTVASIDAHGLSSNYGIQFEVWFNRSKNKIEKRLISGSGAPKPYPNMFLNADTFVDTIKDSNHTKMTIYFDPEYLEIVRRGKKSDPLIATNQDRASYKMQLINVDFQQSQLIDISIDDLRTVKNSGIGSSSKILPYKAYIEKVSGDITEG